MYKNLYKAFQHRATEKSLNLDCNTSVGHILYSLLIDVKYHFKTSLNLQLLTYKCVTVKSETSNNSDVNYLHHRIGKESFKVHSKTQL